METLQDLKKLSNKEIRKGYGGKTLGLFEAHQLGIAIPETWLLHTRYFESKNLPNFESLPDTLFAVRSSSQFEDSADHSFAGIFESKLNVPKNELGKAINDVWNSVHSLRVSSYAEAAEKIKMGIILQPMVEAKYAGVCFSKHPSPALLFENHNLILEFAQGGGEKVVQGEIIPFRLSGTPENILAATDATWTQDLIKALIVLKGFHGHEIDIEFVVDKSEKFILVQQRPVSRTHSSHVLDLSNYERQYKRTLCSLDVEFLIDGCARFLAPYLELPFKLERWMVMTTNPDGQQELWIDKLLNELVIAHLSQHILEDKTFLERIEARYQYHYKMILEKDYEVLFDQNIPLKERFTNFCEFITPLAAHYYVPMFMIEALHRQLLKEIPEDELFSGITTLVEKLNEELRSLKDLPEDTLHQYLYLIANHYGFLKSRMPYDEGYSAEDLLDLKKHLPPKEKLQAIKPNDKLEPFRKWMQIRNVEMEYFMYALLKSRPLFEEMAAYLEVTVKELWYCSREMIVKALTHKDPTYIHLIKEPNLCIYHTYGKTRLNSNLTIIKKVKEDAQLRGKKVYGEGVIEGKALIVFKAKELEGKTIEPGTILVTGMTTPDFAPYLKLFAALITDEGGILCHAAIIAREMQIPCLVGTAMATELLKPGMPLRLDLDRGYAGLL